jgi:hypothetical protein
MSRAKMVGRGAIFFLVAAVMISVVAWGEITLKQGESGEAQWWYCGAHEGLPTELLCSSCSSDFCATADHWGVELATYAPGDWAYVSLYVGKRFTLTAVDTANFYYHLIDPPGVQTDSGPSLAFSLSHPTTGDPYLAIGIGAPPQTASCLQFTGSLTGFWWVGTWNGTDVGTFSLVQTAATMAALQATPVGTYDVQAVLVLMGVVGSTIGSAGGNPIETGQAVIDDIDLGWPLASFGGTYYLEPAWAATVGFDDWTQSPLPGPEDPPREWDRWCHCAHCLEPDDQNLWSIIAESNLDGLDVPAAAKSFPSPDHAVYFGNPSTGNYDMGERAIGCVCSPWNELNPADRYASITFEYFREVEQYFSGAYDWTYVQVLFDDWTGLSWDPFSVTNPGDATGCAGGDWKTVWYKDSRDLNEEEWTEAVVTHYLNSDDDPYTDPQYRIAIPPNATRMRIRFCFNSEDGASNDYFGWLIDNVKKEHAPDPPGCRIITDYLPQAHVGEKYGEDQGGGDYYFALDPEVVPGSTLGPRSWSITSVTKDGDRMTSLPRRLALDPRGRLYGEPDPGTEGTYQIEFLLECWNGRPDQKTLVLNITAPQDPDLAKSLIRFEDFETVSASTWTVNSAPIPPAPGPCPNLWHETPHVKYALDNAALYAEYGDVAYFGQDDNGLTTDPNDPNYICSRAKGCLQSPLIPITEDDHDGEELIIGFKSWRQVEYFTGGEYDRTWVDVRLEGGSWQTVWSKSSKDVSLASWTWQEVHTGVILVKGFKFQVRFCFDSIDSYGNGLTGKCYGWLIDEIGLYAGSTNLGITNCPRDETSVGDYYKEEVRASGGTQALTPIWEIAAGSLPPGLGLVPEITNRRIAYVEGIPRTPGTYTFTIRVRSADWTESATRECTIEVSEEVMLMLEDFEGDPAWSQGGLWHFTADAGVVGVGNLGPVNHAAYYGQDDGGNPNYNTGAYTSGMLTLVAPAVDLTAAPGGGAVEAVKVEFDYWREVEAFGSGGYDKTELQVQLDGGPWHTIWTRDSSNPSMADWITEDGLTPFLSDGAATMLIRFVFDSGDKWYNDFVGWLVDNIRVKTAPAGGASPLSAMRVSSGVVRPRDVASELAVMNIPNPIRDVHTTTFMVRSVDVEAMRITIYDLSGALVFEEEVQGNELVWHTDNDYGEYLANGIYLYRAYVLIGGEWIATTAQKLVILR